MSETKTPRGRKAAPAPEVQAPVELPAELIQAVEEDSAVVRNVDAAITSIAAQQFECVRVIGQMEALNTISQYSTTGLLLLMRQMKDSKAYKGLVVPQGEGKALVVNTFEDFCTLMGTSRRKVDEDLQNLSAFGEQFMDAAQRIGLGYRQIRELRNLSQEERLALAEKSNDPEVLKDFIQEISVQKAKLEAEVKEKDATLDAKDKVLATKGKALDAAQTKLAKLSSLEPDGRAALNAEKQRKALAVITEKAGLALESMVQLFSAVDVVISETELDPHVREHMEGAMNAVGASVADMFGNKLDWKVNFAGMVYPEWMEAQAAKATAAAQPAAEE